MAHGEQRSLVTVFFAAFLKNHSSLLGLFLDFSSGAMSVLGLGDEEYIFCQFAAEGKSSRILKDS